MSQYKQKTIRSFILHVNKRDSSSLKAAYNLLQDLVMKESLQVDTFQKLPYKSHKNVYHRPAKDNQDAWDFYFFTLINKQTGKTKYLKIDEVEQETTSLKKFFHGLQVTPATDCLKPIYKQKVTRNRQESRKVLSHFFCALEKQVSSIKQLCQELKSELKQAREDALLMNGNTSPVSRQET